MDWIYLSPHLDDVALSCGGLLWEQAQCGDAPSVWTICAGDPPAEPLSQFAEVLHQRWGVGRDAVLSRRDEDSLSCALLGAYYCHFPIPDCIYRRSPEDRQALYASEEAIFGAIRPAELSLVGELAALLARKLQDTTEPDRFRLVSPLALGGHVDHRLTRAAVEQLGHPLWYYADYPYVLEKASDIPSVLPPEAKPELCSVSEAGLEAWIESVAAHRTQISTFWADKQAMEDAIRDYAGTHGGVLLWRGL